MGKGIKEISPEILWKRNAHFAANLSPTILKEYEIMADEEKNSDDNVEETAPEEEVIPEGCNCKEEFVNVPCPVHSVMYKTEKAPGDFGEDITVITDANLNLEQPYGRYEGHIFICPKCKMPAIMVNQNMGEYCVKCGAKVLVKSKVVTEHIRSLE